MFVFNMKKTVDIVVYMNGNIEIVIYLHLK